MLEIYFDGVLIPDINYLELTQSWKMFDDTFKLGSTLSREFNLKIPESVFNKTVKNIVIKYNSSDYAHLILDSYQINKGAMPTVDLTLVDRMVLANFNYDMSSLVPCTVKDIVTNICEKIGVEFGNSTFENEDIIVDFYDNTVQARTYLSYIAEVAGGFARIEKDGKLYIRTFSNTTDKEILAELSEQILIGDDHEVERIVYDNGLQKFDKTRPSRNLLLKEGMATDKVDTTYWMTEGLYFLEATNDDFALVGRRLEDKITEMSYSNFFMKKEASVPLKPNTVYTIYIEIKNMTDISGTGVNLNFGDNSPTQTSVFTSNISVPFTDLEKIYLNNNGVIKRTLTTKSQIDMDNAMLFSRGFITIPANSSGVVEMRISVFEGDYTNTKVEYERNIMTEEQKQKLETVYLNSENVFVKNETSFNKIADKILGFKYNNLDTGQTNIMDNILVGDVVKTVYDGNTYYSIAQFESLSYMGLWNGSYRLEVSSPTQQETKIVGDKDKIKKLSVELDRTKNELGIIAENVGEHSSEIGQLIINDSQFQTTISEFDAKFVDNETLEEYQRRMETQFTQTSDTFLFEFNELSQLIQNLDANAGEEWTELKQYIRLENGTIELGNNKSNLVLRLENNIIKFVQAGTEVAYISDNKLYITNGEFLQVLKIGAFAFTPRTSGNLTFGKVG